MPSSLNAIYQTFLTLISNMWPSFLTPWSTAPRQLLLTNTSSDTIPPTAHNYSKLQAELLQNLKQHVIQNWLPRSIDTAPPRGFHQNYSLTWALVSNTSRGAVYQSRNTWLAARAAIAQSELDVISAEEKAKLLEYSNHGVEFLLTKLWDPEHGGFYWKVEGEESEAANQGEKHLYGISFAIYALTENFKAAGGKGEVAERALQTARKAFWWLEEYAHDETNQGYYEAFMRDGTPILEKWGDKTHDSIGTQYGFKSMNSHIHLLEAFTNLYDVWTDEPKLKDRLQELFKLVRETIVVPEVGVMNLFFLPDWRPVPDHDSFGHDVETAFLLVEAGETLGVGEGEMEKTWSIARKLVDHALEYGWDKELGGFYDAGTTFQGTFDPRKVWWIQAEGLNALAVMHEKFGKDTDKYWSVFLQEWEWIKHFQIDQRNSGWIAEVERDGKREKGQRKSDEWTEGYHQGRALLNVARILGALAEGEGSTLR